jgi:hypothetical protein
VRKNRLRSIVAAGRKNWLNGQTRAAGKKSFHPSHNGSPIDLGFRIRDHHKSIFSRVRITPNPRTHAPMGRVTVYNTHRSGVGRGSLARYLVENAKFQHDGPGLCIIGYESDRIVRELVQRFAHLAVRVLEPRNR